MEFDIVASFLYSPFQKYQLALFVLQFRVGALFSASSVVSLLLFTLLMSRIILRACFPTLHHRYKRALSLHSADSHSGLNKIN